MKIFDFFLGTLIDLNKLNFFDFLRLKKSLLMIGISQHRNKFISSEFLFFKLGRSRFRKPV